MSFSDILATVGVTLLLGAFILNSRKLIAADSRAYNAMNIAGALLCAISAYLIKFYPFVVLETAWLSLQVCHYTDVFHVKHLN